MWQQCQEQEARLIVSRRRGLDDTRRRNKSEGVQSSLSAWVIHTLIGLILMSGLHLGSRSWLPGNQHEGDADGASRR